MNKKISILFGILLALPLVLAETEFFEVLDLYHLFVEVVFGNFLFAGVGITALFVVLCIFGRMSYGTIIFLVGTWVMVFAMGYFGALAAVPIFIASFIYFINGMLNLFNAYR